MTKRGFLAERLDAMRIEVVPDDDAQAHSMIPKDILASLGVNNVLTSGSVMYMRESLWRKMKDRFT